MKIIEAAPANNHLGSFGSVEVTSHLPTGSSPLQRARSARYNTTGL
ncbi:hypothetical protein [Embleya sp. NBC_00896]|nr:hypothetical protein OG928_32440 [Embleya sp. NBC_00896]